MKKLTRWISSQYHRHLRVWKILRRPSLDEFKLVSKVSIIGLLAIGAIGFLISVVMKFMISIS